MHIKENINLIQFLETVRLCKAEVYFETAEGDSLALRSALCQYIFCTLSNKPEILYRGNIRFDDPEDVTLVAGYLNA